MTPLHVLLILLMIALLGLVVFLNWLDARGIDIYDRNPRKLPKPAQEPLPIQTLSPPAVRTPCACERKRFEPDPLIPIEGLDPQDNIFRCSLCGSFWEMNVAGNLSREDPETVSRRDPALRPDSRSR